MPRYKEDINAIYISERMQECLRRIGESMLTAIIAPMGYGKTTAVYWYLKYRQVQGDQFFRVNIYSDDISLFWKSFRTAFHDTEFGKQIGQLEFPVGKTAIGLFVQAVAEYLYDRTEQFFLFIDDYHLMNDSQVTELLLALCNIPVDNLHIIVASRGSFLPRGSELRLGNRLHTITIHDLQLNPTELSVYARRCGVPVGEKELAELEKLSEGWFSAVYLNLKFYSETGRLLSVSEDIYELINGSLIVPLDKRTQVFLEVMCLADEFTVEQARYMTEIDDAAGIVASLIKTNTFVRFLADTKTYRFHHMLRESMYRRFNMLPKSEQAIYEKRFARWLANMKDYFYAAVHFERAGDWCSLLEVMGKDHGLSFGPERLPDVKRWYEACPKEELQRYPAAIMVFMLDFFYAREIPKMMALYELFNQSMAQDTTLSAAEREQLEGEVLLRLSFLKFNNISGMSEYHRKIRALSTPHRNPWTQGSPSVLFLYHSKAGNLDRENEEMRECMPIYYRISHGHGSGAIYIMQGETDLMRGDLLNAEINYQRAIREVRARNEYSMMIAAEFLAARIALYQPNTDPLSFFTPLRDELVEARQYRLVATLEMAESWLCTLLGQNPPELQWVWQEENAPLRVFPLVLPIFHIIAGQALLMQKKWSQVVARKETLAEKSQNAHFLLCTIYLHIQTAAAYEMLNQRGEALAELHSAMNLAAPDGILLPFAENGVYLNDLLGSLRNEYPKQIQKILELADAISEAMKKRSAAPSADFGLSERELAVARLAVQGLTRKEISEELYLSEHTVKNYITRIFDKLGLTGTARQKQSALMELLQSDRK